MRSNKLKTAVITSMFISVLFLSGCGIIRGVDDQTPAIKNNTTIDSDDNNTIAPTTGNDKPSTTTEQPTPAANTTTGNTGKLATKTYTSDFQSYRTPAGDEEVKVTAVVDSKGIVQNVELAFVTHADISKKFQNLFSEGISAQVVGKSIKDVNVGVVNGSSLTGNGFNKAINQIEQEYNAAN